LRETFFPGRRAQRYAIQQDLIAGCAQQQSAATAFIQSHLQLFPGGLELRSSARVPKFV
jgi:hypothetical protein